MEHFSEKKTNINKITIPDKFPSIIRDFINDLSITFSEYSYLWEKWGDSDADFMELYKYCLGIYPERFFDILYQNDEIFTNDTNTYFLPLVEFKLLFKCEGISEKTKQTIWKYLQLIMITIMTGIDDKSIFGDTMNLFDGINEEDLHSKLSETISGLSDFFKENMDKSTEENNNKMPNMEEFENMFHSNNMPDPNDLNEHLKSLFGGKIGALAKELAEELSEDIMKMFGEDEIGGEVKTTEEVLKKIMKNPAKMMELLKKVSNKLDKKMKDGDINQSDIMKEASEIMGKMKEMGGGKQFQDMMKNMAKSMPGMAGMMGKNSKFDVNALSRMTKTESMKERMRTKLETNKCKLEEKSPNNLVFKIEGEEGQEKSIAPINDDWLDDSTKKVSSSIPKSNKKKKGKSGKK
jgi:hypothetical protein